MADISLEDLMKNKAQTESQETTTAVVVPEQEIAVVTQKVETLSPEDQRKVQTIKDNIDLMDTSTPLKFGVEAQKEIAQFSDSILSKVRTKDRNPLCGGKESILVFQFELSFPIC